MEYNETVQVESGIALFMSVGGGSWRGRALNSSLVLPYLAVTPVHFSGSRGVTEASQESVEAISTPPYTVFIAIISFEPTRGCIFFSDRSFPLA